MQEHARPLPKPARKGRGTFTFKKSLDGQAGLLGVKVFDAELEGDARADTRELLGALLDASTTRIQWTGTGQDLITSIEVRESDIFSKKRIGLRITARGMPEDAQTGKDANIGLPLSGINFGIFDDFVPEFAEVATPPDAYGAPLILSFKKQMFLPYNDYEVLPKAKLLGMPGSEVEISDGTNVSAIEEWSCAEEVTETEYQWQGDFDPVGIPSPNSKWDLSGDVTEQSEGSQEFKYLNVKGTEQLAIKSNIQLFSAHSKDSIVTVPWQVDAPTIIWESTYTMSRLRKPPPMLFLKQPKTGIILSQESSVEDGGIDSAGNHIYIRKITRRVQLLYGTNDPAIPEIHKQVTFTFQDEAELDMVIHYIDFDGLDYQSKPYNLQHEEENAVADSYMLDTEIGYPLNFSFPFDNE